MEETSTISNLLDLDDLDQVTPNHDLQSSPQNLWESDIKFHCDQIRSKVFKKEEELKLIEKDIEISRTSLNKEREEAEIKLNQQKLALEEQYQRMCKEGEEAKILFDQTRNELEEQYEEKLQVASIYLLWLYLFHLFYWFRQSVSLGSGCRYFRLFSLHHTAVSGISVLLSCARAAHFAPVDHYFFFCSKGCFLKSDT